MVQYTNVNISTGSISVASPSVTGAQVSAPSASQNFHPWQPSQWPPPPANFDNDFVETLRRIFSESMLGEIENIIKDAETVNHGLEHRGHVIAITMFCAVDVLSSYAFTDVSKAKCTSCGRSDRVGPRYEKFITSFFPKEYRPHAKTIYTLYRNSMVHSWNLFRETLSPEDSPVTVAKSGTLTFGIKNFFNALRSGADEFLNRLKTSPDLQKSALRRYKELRQMARP